MSYRLRSLGVSLVAVTLLGASACSGEDAPGTAATAEPTAAAASPTSVPEVTATAAGPSATAAPASPTAAPSPTATEAPASGLEALSLVYVDTRRGQGGDIYVAEADGAGPRLVVSEPDFMRPLDVAGGTLAAVGQDGVLLIDLTDGAVETIEDASAVFSGRFFDAQTFFYSTSGGCAAGSGALYRVELPSPEVAELVTAEQSMTLIGHDAAANTLAALPRGCDVGISAIDVYDALTGELRNSLAVEGCGWAIAALDQNKAVTSWQSCTPPAGHANADVTVYDFGIVGPAGNDVTVPVVEPNAAIWVLRPGRAEAAFGTSTTLGAGPGSTRSGGIYLLNLASRQFRQLLDGEGAEQYPIAWSPDGRYLLYATVEAQGLCSFSYVDAQANDPEPVPVNAEITFCGVNGQVVGWTRLP